MSIRKSKNHALIRLTALSVLAHFAANATAATLPAAGQFGPHPLFDSAHSIAAKGTLPAGLIQVDRGLSDSAVAADIQAQLYYVVGQLNGINGVVDMSKLTVSVGERTPIDGNTESVAYAAELFIAWPTDVKMPSTYELVMPTRGDYRGLTTMFQTFGDEHGDLACMEDGAHEVSQGILWYFYRPLKRSCPLRDATTRDPKLAVAFDMNLEVSDQNTEGKFPEYEMVWKDNRLVITAIFGLNDYENASDYDPGVEAMQELYSRLQETYGKPVSTTLEAGQTLGLKNRSVDVSFDTPKGRLEAHLFVVDGIRMVDAAFTKRYNELTRISDFVSYSGHSGLGANIQALARMGEFEKDQYQIYLINGCDTFAYVDNALRDAHAAANPGFGKDKFFDVITNAMPSYFAMNATSNMAVINALMDRKATYREILSNFDISQRAVVTGEQDNRFPAPFYDK